MWGCSLFKCPLIMVIVRQRAGHIQLMLLCLYHEWYPLHEFRFVVNRKFFFTISWRYMKWKWQSKERCWRPRWHLVSCDQNEQKCCAFKRPAWFFLWTADLVLGYARGLAITVALCDTSWSPSENKLLKTELLSSMRRPHRNEILLNSFGIWNLEKIALNVSTLAA